jgi:serine/threonine-protein kinase
MPKAAIVGVMEPAVEQEIATLVREAIAKHGMAGEVTIRSTSVVLEGYGATVSTELGLLGDQWELLPLDVRVRRAGEVARRLADARRIRSIRPTSKTGLGLGWLGPVALVALLGAGLWGAYRVVGAKSNNADVGAAARSAALAPTSAADAYEAERAARAARVCAATRERVLRGVSVAMTDAEGWVVELVLLRGVDTAEMHLDPALDTFFAFDGDRSAARLVWAGTPGLSEISDAFSRVHLDHDAAPDPARARSLRLTFGGAYVSPYFDAERRGQYLKLAGTLAERLAATHGALYARCADRQTHEIGSWFRAPNPAAAAASLIYFMGTFSDVPQLRAALLRPAGQSGTASDSAGTGSTTPVDRAFAFAAIHGATTALGYGPFRTLLGDFGGAIAGRPEGPTTVTFDFKDASRASKASFRLARELKIADSR